jgi:hypothetical protein
MHTSLNDVGTAAEKIRGAIPSRHRQPAAKSGRIPQCMQLLPGAEEYFLDQIVDLVEAGARQQQARAPFARTADKDQRMPPRRRRGPAERDRRRRRRAPV